MGGRQHGAGGREGEWQIAGPKPTQIQGKIRANARQTEAKFKAKSKRNQSKVQVKSKRKKSKKKQKIGIIYEILGI